MKNLIEEVNEPLFKALAKNYLKLIKQRDPQSSQTLSSIQEDLARVVGYPDLHAAQVQWAKHATPQYILEHATPEERKSAIKSIEWTFSYLENNFHVFTREKLLDTAVEFDKKIATTDAEKSRWKILVEEMLKEYEENIVKVRIPGGITTKKLNDKCVNLVRLAQSHDPRRMIPGAAFQSPDTSAAVKSVCQMPSQLNIIRADSDEAKYAGMKDMKAAYERAGFHVEVVSTSWKDGMVPNEIKGSKAVGFLGSWLETISSSSPKKPHFSGPVAFLVDNADEVALKMLEAFLENLAPLPHTTKVVLFSLSNAINPHSTMKVLSQELNVFSMEPPAPTPTRSPRP